MLTIFYAKCHGSVHYDECRYVESHCGEFRSANVNVTRKHKLECSFQSSLMFELSLEPISVSPGLTSKY